MKTGFKNLKLVDHPLIKRDITLLRDKSTNTENFRAAVRRISNILAVSVSKGIKLSKFNVETPLERTKGFKLEQEIVLVPVLRAGLSMVSGFIDIIPDSKVGHIGLQRDENTLQPIEYYYKIPYLNNNTKVILLDPMLATGGSANEALKYLKGRGAKDLIFTCLIAAPEGVKKILKNHPEIQIYSAVLDRELNERGYILPGLGDAGDRTFGTL